MKMTTPTYSALHAAIQRADTGHRRGAYREGRYPRAERYPGRANRATINRAFRAADASHLWPIYGRFDATERAIRSVQRFMRDGGYNLEGLEYALAVDAELSAIVNSTQ